MALVTRLLLPRASSPQPELTLNPKLGLKALDLAPTLTVSTTPLDLKVQAGVSDLVPTAFVKSSVQ